MNKLKIQQDSKIYDKIGISSALFNGIISIISANNKIKKVALFGSRRRGSFNSYSDIDLAIYSKIITSKEINIIKNTLEELPTALKFDVIGFDSINNKILKKKIENEGIIIYEK